LEAVIINNRDVTPIFHFFGKTAPDTVISIEERVRLEQHKKDTRRVAKQQRAMETI
jgi:hypothetical protein